MPKSSTSPSSAMPDKTKVPPGSLDHLRGIRKEKWEIQYREPYGRCIVACQDIQEGDVLFLDHPVMTGPKQDTGFLCLGCYKQLETPPQYLCSKCGWPVCDKECETEGYHYLECEAFSKSSYKFSATDSIEVSTVNEAILPLRCLLLQEKDDTKWKTLTALESHDDLRRGGELWLREQTHVCDVIRQKIGLNISDDLIHTMTGILDVNCHEVKTTVPGTRLECRVRGLFPLCAMMSHDCVSNTMHTFTDNMTMLIVASRAIPKGEQVTGIYTHMLSGTTERRKHLRYGKFFDCVCSRCRDPTELGTFFSALRCTRPGCSGDVLCKNPLQSDNKADYACNKCGHEVPVSMVSRLTNLIYYELQDMPNGDLDKLEEIYDKYKKLLHPNHFHMIGIKHTLSQSYGRCVGYMIGDLSDAQLERKVECCRDILRITDVVDPGISRLRGLTKYELHAPLLLKANKEFQAKRLTKTVFLQQLQEVLQLLHKTAHCLQFEHCSTQEGEVCRISKSSAAELQKWVSTVKQLPANHFLPEPQQEEFDEDLAREESLTLEALLRKVESY